jgi:hypothetical protein
VTEEEISDGAGFSETEQKELVGNIARNKVAGNEHVCIVPDLMLLTRY